MRSIKHIVIHCSATKEGKYFEAEDINRWHKKRGWKGIGYHYVVLLDGSIELGRDIRQRGAHVKGFNNHSIGICYIGGLNKHSKAKDTRTTAQKLALFCLVENLKEQFPNAEVLGHRDFSEDKNNNKIIDPSEFMKDCPCFDAKTEYKNIITI